MLYGIYLSGSGRLFFRTGLFFSPEERVKFLQQNALSGMKVELVEGEKTSLGLVLTREELGELQGKKERRV